MLNIPGYTLAEFCQKYEINRSTVEYQLKVGYCAWPRKIIKGQRDHPLYQTWRNIKQRCHNVSSRDYIKYGAKGVTMYMEWRCSFERFASDVGLPPKPYYTLDRIDTFKGYTPDNVRWASYRTQSRNKVNYKHNIEESPAGTYRARLVVCGKKLNTPLTNYYQALIDKEQLELLYADYM